MRSRSSSGATLVLVISCIFVVVLIGIGFFFLTRIMGGGREIQQVTDSGAINVARNALFTPTATTPDANLLALLPSGTTTFDLATYNQAVGELALISLNVQFDPTTPGKNNVVSLAKSVTKLGGSLQSQLNSSTGFGTSFNAITGNTLLNLFGAQTAQFQPASPNPPGAGSFLAAGNGSNVTITDNAPLYTIKGLGAAAVTPSQAGGTAYLSGYTALPGIPNMAVPMRPRETPHLVSLSAFTNGQTAPADPSVPPNTFLVQSQALEAKSNKNSTASAAAIIGTVDTTTESPARIPNGYIVFDNGNFLGGGTGALGLGGGQGGTVTFSVTTTADPSLLASLLMPNSYELFADAGGNIWSTGAPSGDPNCINNLIAYICSFPNLSSNPLRLTVTVPQLEATGLVGCVDDGHLPASTGTASLQNLIDQAMAPGGTSQVTCDSNNITSAPCFNILGQVESVFGGDTDTKITTVTTTGFTAIEAAKADIIDIRASVGGIGSAPTTNPTQAFSFLTGQTLVVNSSNSSGTLAFGTNAVNPTPAGGTGIFHTDFPSEARDPSLFNLLDLSNVPTGSGSEVFARLLEMSPTQSASSINTFLTSNTLPAGTIAIVYADSTGAFHMTAPATSVAAIPFPASFKVPAFSGLGQADGTTISSTSTAPNEVAVAGNLTLDQNKDGGFNQPFSGPILPAVIVTNQAAFKRSSGFNGLLGVFRFSQSAQTQADSTTSTTSSTIWFGPC